MFVSLDSVGCVIDTKQFLVHPQMADGSIDLDNGVHIDDVDEDWVKALSRKDFATLGRVIGVLPQK